MHHTYLHICSDNNVRRHDKQIIALGTHQADSKQGCAICHDGMVADTGRLHDLPHTGLDFKLV